MSIWNHEIGEGCLPLVAAYGRELTLLPFTRLQEQDTLPSYVYYLKSGLVALSRTESSGHELAVALRTVGFVEPLSLLGIKLPVLFSARTLCLSLAYRVPAAEFALLLSSHPHLVEHIHQQQSSDVRAAVGSYVRSVAWSPVDRLLFFLYELSLLPGWVTTRGDYRYLRLPLTYANTARLIGISPEHLSRLLGRMEKESLLRRSKGWIGVSERTFSSVAPLLREPLYCRHKQS